MQELIKLSEKLAIANQCDVNGAVPMRGKNGTLAVRFYFKTVILNF